MQVAIKWAVILGGVVTLLNFVFGAAGLHKNGPFMPLMFVAVAIVVNIVVVVMALRQTKETTAWGGQVLNGLVIGVVGAVIVFLGSWIMMGVVFTDYIAEMRDGYAAFFESQPQMTQEQIDAALAGFDQMTPATGAIQGAVGTFFTSVIVAGIAGIFLRKK